MNSSFNVNPVFLKAAEDYFKAKVLVSKKLGKGATGNVYCLEFSKKPFKAALKISTDNEMMLKETSQLKLLYEKAGKGFPMVYFTVPEASGESAICMELFDGISAGSFKSRLKIRSKGKIFAEGAIDALLNLHNVTNDKFGPVDNAVYDEWTDFYKPFAESVLLFSLSRTAAGELTAKVSSAMQTAFLHFDEIFSEGVEKPVLIHGDFWPPNLIIDSKTMEYLGAIDPFNVMWADPEYDLFGMILGRGKQFKLLETYKIKHNISKKFAIKLEFYALFNEVYWYSLIKTKNDWYLKFKAKKLIHELKKANII